MNGIRVTVTVERVEMRLANGEPLTVSSVTAQEWRDASPFDDENPLMTALSDTVGRAAIKAQTAAYLARLHEPWRSA